MTPPQSSTPTPISESITVNTFVLIGKELVQKPFPPTEEMIDKAQFKDKTFRWNKKRK